MTTTAAEKAQHQLSEKAPKPAAPEPTPEELAAAKAEQKRIDALRAKLRKNAERKAELVREERDLIVQLRETEVPWRLLAEDVHMSHVGLQRRYRDLIDAAKAAKLTGK